MWTDSKIVLHYLQNEDHNFGLYVLIMSRTRFRVKPHSLVA